APTASSPCRGMSCLPIGAVSRVLSCPAPSSCCRYVLHPFGCMIKRKIHPFGEKIVLYYIHADEQVGLCAEESTVATLGERLSVIRERSGLTQGEVARRVRLPQQAISRLERGEREHVRSDVLARFAVALDVSADVLLGLRELSAGEAAFGTAKTCE